MTCATEATGPLLAEWVACLDDQIALGETAVGQLQAVSDAIMARDDRGLETLAAELKATCERLEAAGSVHRDLRGRLAGAWGWPEQRVTLTRLADEVDPDRRADILDRRHRLQRVYAALRDRHLATTTLVVACGEVNRTLLEGLFGSRGVATYGTDGTSHWRPEGELFSAER